MPDQQQVGDEVDDELKAARVPVHAVTDDPCWRRAAAGDCAYSTDFIRYLRVVIHGRQGAV